MLMTVVKTITDLERIGDEAAKIARMAKLIYSADRLQQPRTAEIRRMSQIALKCCASRWTRSPAGSGRLRRGGAPRPARGRGIPRRAAQLITFMMEDPRTISVSIEILFIAKAIERIGDHAKNISEYVIYMVKGKDVRHVTLEEIEREVNGLTGCSANTPYPKRLPQRTRRTPRNRKSAETSNPVSAPFRSRCFLVSCHRLSSASSVSSALRVSLSLGCFEAE